MRKESAIIRKCSAQRTGEPFHYASIQHILSNVMNAGILRSGETKSEVFPELQIVSLEQFNRVAKTREQRSVNYAIKCGGTTETVQLEDGTEATVVRPPRAYPRKIVGKALLSGNVYCGHCGGRIFAATARKTHRPTESNERIAIYKCYNRSQHKGQCDGPSTYRAEKVDKVIEQLLRGIFERAKKVDEKTILKMLVDASAEQCQQELKAAKLEYSMLSDLRDKLLSENRLFTPYNIWSNYKMLDMNGDVEDLDVKQNIKALTHLIQLVRYAYKKTDNLKSLLKGYSQRFTLYCGQAQRPLSPDQQEIMKAIADYIINEGSISVTELNSIDTDLWRKAVKSFGIPALTAEMIDLSKFILKAA